MSNSGLTKEEAYQLITSIVDDEVDGDTRNKFFSYIEADKDVRKEFKSVKRVKTLVSRRCPYHKAPDRLRVWVRGFIFSKKKGYSQNGDNREEPVLDMPSKISLSEPAAAGGNAAARKTETGYTKWLYSAAASVLVILAFWGLVYNNQINPETYNMEEYVYRHFQNYSGKLIPPTINTASLADAEVQLASQYNIEMKVPSLKQAEFKGVVYDEFVPDFSAPLFEYYLPAENQYIYIFAFDLKELDAYNKLTRDREAVQTCIKQDDFHIKDINGKHVLSWRWDGTWYAAISNHNGKTLASLVEPLRSE